MNPVTNPAAIEPGHAAELEAVASAMLDATWLSNALGHAVVPTRLRVKPQHSVVVAWKATEPTSALAAENWGWARVMWPTVHSKLAKVEKQAADRGLAPHRISRRVVPGIDSHNPGDLIFQQGPLIADPKLIKGIGQAGITESVEVLRYNPLRRLVVRAGDHVTRITAAPNTVSTALYEELGNYVPVPARLDAGKRHHRCDLEFVGRGDLDSLRTADTQVQARVFQLAGQELARLHNAQLAIEPALLAGTAPNRIDVCAQVRAHVELFSVMAPDLARRLDAVSGKLANPGGPEGLLHGDLSPDQFLYDLEPDRLWLTDFDHLHVGPAALDLGSLTSLVDAPAQDAFLAGYAETAQRVPDPRELDVARAGALALRAAEPLRAAQPTWRAEISRTLTRIEELVNS